jgi:hypothetical protein
MSTGSNPTSSREKIDMQHAQRPRNDVKFAPFNERLRTTTDNVAPRSQSPALAQANESRTHGAVLPALPICLYQESGWTAHVRIVSDRSDNEFERCTLQVVEQLRRDSSMSTPEVGELFEFLWRRGIICTGIGRLVRD